MFQFLNNLFDHQFHDKISRILFDEIISMEIKEFSDAEEFRKKSLDFFKHLKKAIKLEMNMKVSEPIEHSWSNIRQSFIETFSNSNKNSFLNQVSKEEGWIEEWLGTVEKNNILEELNVLDKNNIKKQTKVLRF